MNPGVIDVEAWFVNFTNSIQFEMILRLALAAVLGGVVGMERGSGDRPAGFRTHILVCAGSALIMLVSMYGFEGFDKVPFEYPKNRDSARIAAQVVSGIGFLGAGTILHEGITVRGLTTAASLWMISAIGLATGAGMYFVSITATVITFLTLTAFHSVEKRFAVVNSKSDKKYVRVTASNIPGLVAEVASFLALNGIKVKTINVQNSYLNDKVVLELYLKFNKELDLGMIMDGLQQIEGIKSIENVG
jgi:putative Mg2+ transporter-C (MgtC) family protein